jgi:hypothetical protein
VPNCNKYSEVKENPCDAGARLCISNRREGRSVGGGDYKSGVKIKLVAVPVTETAGEHEAETNTERKTRAPVNC